MQQNYASKSSSKLDSNGYNISDR
jgi:hypothetical protein